MIVLIESNGMLPLLIAVIIDTINYVATNEHGLWGVTNTTTTIRRVRGGGWGEAMHCHPFVGAAKDTIIN